VPDPGPGTGPWRTGAGFIPALLTALAASLIYCFSTSLPVLVARSAAACWLRITWCRGSLRPQSGIADPEHLAGEAVAMLAEQVRDDVSDPVGYARPMDFERHRVDGDVALTQF
jgi:hypothetical protein